LTDLAAAASAAALSMNCREASSYVGGGIGG
jgi:hypothetical protein